MALTVVVGLTFALGVVSLLTALRAQRAIPPLPTAPVQPYDDSGLRTELELVSQELEVIRADYEEWRADINTAVAEGIKHVERAEARIRATVRRAREELEEGGVRSPGLEAEALELFGVNGGRSEPQPMPTVQPSVAGGEDRFSAFPGAWDGF